MARLFTIVGLLLAALLLLGAALWYLAYEMDTRPPSRAELAGLGMPVGIEWMDDGSVVVTADSEPDALAALGYAHGQTRAWHAALYRQAALGGLTAWFGDEALEEDVFAHRLGFAAGARAAYAALDTSARAAVDAYAAGLDAALRADNVRRSDAFVLHEVAPARWEPWHVLAVERLLAWLATRPPTFEAAARAGSDVLGFFEADQALRRRLHLHGVDGSLTAFVADSTGRYLVHRQVLGADVEPILLEAAFVRAGDTTRVASLPGTILLPAGVAPGRAWSVLLSGRARLRAGVRDSSFAPAYARVLDAARRERLLRAYRSDSLLAFEPPTGAAAFARLPADTLETPLASLAAPRPARADTSTTASDTLRVAAADTARAAAADTLLAASAPAPDSTWVLGWAGLGDASDIGASLALLRGEEARFALFSGSGLRTLDADVRLVGRPAAVARGRDIVVAAAAEHAADAAIRLDSLRLRAPGRPGAWLDDAYSPFAARVVPVLMTTVDSLLGHSPAMEGALAYLRNWDFRYDQASIGASIFDAYLRAHERELGRLPQPAAVDTTSFDDLLHYSLLERAVETLLRSYGTDQTQWRWERVAPARRFFAGYPSPPLATDSLAAALAPSSRRFSPLQLPGRGHVSALAWGATLREARLPAPAAWEAWLDLGTGAMHVRRLAFDPHRFLGRYVVPDEAPPFVPAASGRRAGTTQLMPAS